MEIINIRAGYTVKIHYLFYLLFFVTGLEARVIDVADKLQADEHSPLNASSHFDGDSLVQPRIKTKKTDLSSVKKGRKSKEADLLSPINDRGREAAEALEETPEAFLILSSDEESPAPEGGGVLTHDPKMEEKCSPPSSPETKLSWWKRWWNGLVEWLFAEAP